jgi:tRNA A37 N6-isopentenylltransferase MiaA
VHHSFENPPSRLKFVLEKNISLQLKISINKKIRNGLANGVVDRVTALYAALHIAAGR